MAQVNLRIDDNTKEQAEKLFQSLGMSLSTAFNVFIKQSLRDGGLPFRPTTAVDPFFSPSNMAVLMDSIRDAENGKLTAHELIEE